MSLLYRIRLTLHSAIEVVQNHATTTPREARLPDTLILKKPGNSTLRQLRVFHAD